MADYNFGQHIALVCIKICRWFIQGMNHRPTVRKLIAHFASVRQRTEPTDARRTTSMHTTSVLQSMPVICSTVVRHADVADVGCTYRCFDRPKTAGARADAINGMDYARFVRANDASVTVTGRDRQLC
jgi:hypothetical protein